AGGDDAAHAPYMAAKRRLAALSRTLALELAPRLILNCVAPGAVLEPNGAGRDALLRLAPFNPMRAVGTPEGLAACVVFLLRQDFVAGQVLFYDGGRHLRDFAQ
ncbi:MAG: SDR family oxidoreductase, partial [Kiritimatiellae bacterium]|nr:SDR family oxidoreductase [Kiritimatiellia bacterium]